MDFIDDVLLNQDQRDLRAMVRQFATEVIAPQAEANDRADTMPWDIIAQMGELGLFGVGFPEEYGGGGGLPSGDIVSHTILAEELSKADRSVGGLRGASVTAGLFLLWVANETQRAKYLPEITSGRKLAATAATEPDAGSDIGGLRTRAVKHGDTYVLNGRKVYCSNAPDAEYYNVFARTDPNVGKHKGVSVFLVEKGTKGFHFGERHDKMGSRAYSTGELVFEDCEVPAENLIGEENQGFYYLMNLFDRFRPTVGAQAIGVAQAALDYSARYANQRKQFDKPIGEFQAIRMMIADMATRIQAARLLIYQAAIMVDRGAESHTKEASMAKGYATNVATWVCNNAIQVLGGAGYMRDYPVERWFRDVRVLEIGDGTTQIQKLIVGREVLREHA